MTMTNQLDAHDALMFMAEAFDGADERGYAVVNGRRFNCLCHAASELHHDKRISAATLYVIRAIICKSITGEFGAYLFPHTRDGARQRAAWCRAEAAKLRPVETWNGRTTVRCWRDGIGFPSITAYTSDNSGVAIGGNDYHTFGTALFKESDRIFNWAATRLDPDEALAALSKSPDSQRKLREMFAANPVPADVVPATRVRCWHLVSLKFFVAYPSPQSGNYYDYERRQTRQSINEYASLEAGLYQGYEEISPVAALDLLRDWPEGRERFLAYCREHPPESPPVRTVADVLREMEKGTRFHRPQWFKLDWCEKIGDDAYSWKNGDLYRQYEFLEQDAPADDSERGITILPAAEPVEQPASTPALQNLLHECDVIGSWLSAALDDADSCDKFKADIHRFLDATNAVVEMGITPRPMKQPTVDVTCKGCGNVLRGLTRENIAFCMECGTDNEKPEQPAGVVVTESPDVWRLCFDAVGNFYADSVYKSLAESRNRNQKAAIEAAAFANAATKIQRLLLDVRDELADARRKAGG